MAVKLNRNDPKLFKSSLIESQILELLASDKAKAYGCNTVVELIEKFKFRGHQVTDVNSNIIVLCV